MTRISRWSVEPRDRASCDRLSDGKTRHGGRSETSIPSPYLANALIGLTITNEGEGGNIINALSSGGLDPATEGGAADSMTSEVLVADSGVRMWADRW